jgi:hypothetical protein
LTSAVEAVEGHHFSGSHKCSRPKGLSWPTDRRAEVWLTAEKARSDQPRAADAVIPLPAAFSQNVHADDLLRFRNARDGNRVLRGVGDEDYPSRMAAPVSSRLWRSGVATKETQKRLNGLASSSQIRSCHTPGPG